MVNPELTELGVMPERRPNSPRSVWMLPGQGDLAVGSGKEAYDTSSHARAIFAAGNKILGRPKGYFEKLCFEGPFEELVHSPNGQPALYLVELAQIAAAVENDDPQNPKLVKPDIIAEYSAGAPAALFLAGGVTFKEGLLIARARGEYTQYASDQRGPIKMGTIIKSVKTRPEDFYQLVEDACMRYSGDGKIVQVSAYNSPSTVGITGDEEPVLEAIDFLSDKVKYAQPKEGITIASHCEIMKPGAEKFRSFLESHPVNDLTIPFIMNGEVVVSGGLAQRHLWEELTVPVYWDRTSRVIADRGITGVLEVSVKKLEKKEFLARCTRESIKGFEDIPQEKRTFEEAVLV